MRHWALVESQRTSRGPRQRVVAYLGDVAEELVRGVEDAASGKPRQGDLFDEASAEWVEVDARRVRVERARSFGGAWLALQLVSELELGTFLAGELDGGREEVPWSQAAKILMVQRLLDPSSELSVAEGGYEKTALPELLGVPAERVNDDRLYRTLDRLLPAQGKLEKHLKSASVRCSGSPTICCSTTLPARSSRANASETLRPCADTAAIVAATANR